MRVDVIPAARLGAVRDELAALLVETVASGASVGFAHPLPPEDARAYWDGVIEDATQGRVVVLGACADDGLAGTVQLCRSRYPNGRHRGEVAKLMVRRSMRRRGVGSALLGGLEATAREMGLTLLFLDTHVGSAAEALYARAGWTRAGVIPRFAYRPDGGGPEGTAFWYRELD